MHKLLEPNVTAIAPQTHASTHDSAPETLAGGSPAWLRDDLAAIVGPAEVHATATDLIRYATDASPYRLFPRIVVSPRSVREVAAVFAYARKKRIPVTIRAAGSSLSGQSQGDGILIDARKHWAGWVVEEEGARLRVKPGTVLFARIWH